MAHAVADGAKSIEGVEVILKKGRRRHIGWFVDCRWFGSRHAGEFRLHVRDGEGFFDRTYNGAQEKVFRKPLLFSSARETMEQEP